MNNNETLVFDPISSECNRILTFTDIERGEKIHKKALDFYCLIDHVWGCANEILDDAEKVASDFHNPGMKREIKEQESKVRNMMQYLESYHELEFQGVVSMCTSARIHIIEITAHGFLNSNHALAKAKININEQYHHITRWSDFDSICNEMQDDFFQPNDIDGCNNLAARMVSKRLAESLPLESMQRKCKNIKPYFEVVAILVK